MRRQGSGQALIEYVVLLALASLVAIGTVSLAGRQLADAYSQVSALLANPAAAIVPTPSPTPTPVVPATVAPTAAPTPTPTAAPTPSPTEPNTDPHTDGNANGHSHHQD
jgi:Flp pilus assembly pilin Flp